MIKAITIIVCCLLAGNVINRLTGLPVPGPVLGMVLLLLLLIHRGGPDHAMKQSCHGLLHNMALLFVPASSGLITQLPVLDRNAWPIAVAIVASTVIGMAATAGTMHILTARGRR